MIFLDIESTTAGDNPDPALDRILELYMTDDCGWSQRSFFNPGSPINPASTAIHGITDRDVQNESPFSVAAPTLAKRLTGATLCGFGVARYDVPLLAEEFARAGVEWDFSGVVVVDLDGIYKQVASRRLKDAVREYLGRDHEGAHSALSDTVVLPGILAEMRRRHPELPKGDAELAMYSAYGKRLASPDGKLYYDDEGRMCYGTFRNRGVRVLDDPNYGKWMCGTNFPEATLAVLRKELAKLDRRPTRSLFDRDEGDGDFDDANGVDENGDPKIPF